MNNPQSPAYTVRGVVEQMKGFDGRLTVQTMFLRGECDGQKTDNTTEEEVSAWLRLIEETGRGRSWSTRSTRDTPCRTLEKVPREEPAGHRRPRRSARHPLFGSITRLTMRLLLLSLLLVAGWTATAQRRPTARELGELQDSVWRRLDILRTTDRGIRRLHTGARSIRRNRERRPHICAKRNRKRR